MTLLLLLAAAVLGYAFWKGWLSAAFLRWAVGGAAVVLAILLVARGSPLLAAALLLAAGAWAWSDARRAALSPLAPADEAEARAILGVDAGAGEAEIRAAHRRRIAEVHPDRGGSAEAARRVNAARDRLLARLRRTG